MMLDATELRRHLGIQQSELDTWIEAGWLRPARVRDEWWFSLIDRARAEFILDLRNPMGVNDEGVAVILDLLDQIHGLRRALQVFVSSTSVQEVLLAAREPADTGAPNDNPPPTRTPRPRRRGEAAA